MPTFKNHKEALALPPPPPGRDSYDVKHASQPGFYVRIMKPTKEGRVRRSWVWRWTEKVADGNGGFKDKEHRPPFAAAVAVEPGEVVMSYEDALTYVLQHRQALRSSQVEGTKHPRMTVRMAIEAYPKERGTNRDRTLQKDLATMERYFGHIADRFLDELNYRFWSRFVADLKAGTLQVGFTEQNGERVPILLGPLASATLLGVLNAASTLYDIAHLYEGLQGMARGDNPPKQAKELVSTPRQKKKLIEMDHLGKAWAASGTLVAPYWRDLFRVCVLTGLRRSLVWSMRFDEIDFAKGVYLIDPLKEGTKQRGRDFGEDPEMMRIPLSAPVMNILRERRLFAPDKDGPVWYAPGKNQGRRKMGETLGDQRSSWAIISEYATGYHFGPQDVRRTFATVGSLAVRDDLFSVALLMMHSTSTLARTANLPEITVRYINTPSAQAQMRAAAEKIAAYVQDLANKAVAGVQVNIETPELPPELEAAVGSE